MQFFKRLVIVFVFLCTSIAHIFSTALPAYAELQHGLSMHGDLKYGPDFTHFDYVNPDAPQGGSIRIGHVGTFDNLNPFIIRGSPVWFTRGLVFESLMTRTKDEPFALYPRIAKAIEIPEDRSSLTFHLDPDARFSDGTAITAEDVIYSMETLRDYGRPNFKAAYQRIAEAEMIDEYTVRFIFKESGDREFPLILGLMPVLPKHALDVETFQKTTLEPLIGSGPYTIDTVDSGTKVIFRKNPDYWAKDKPFARGFYNFETIVHEYFRDGSTLFESFKKGLIDIHEENDPGDWAINYDFPAVRDGRIQKVAFEKGLPKNPSGFVMNTRRDIFKDVRVRKALALLFDANWINGNLFHGLYERTHGYFDTSELSSIGHPASEFEKKLLSPFADQVTASAMSGTWRFPDSDGSGRDRSLLRAALNLMRDAGWELQGRTLIKDGKPFQFEFLAQTREQERLALAYQNTLRLAGITMTIRSVDSSQYQEKLRRFDYDMIQFTWFQSLSPGNEQFGRWTETSASADGSFNMAGVTTPATEAIIQALLAADNRPEFIDAARALDRILISGFYIIPLFHTPADWVAVWNHIQYPQTNVLLGFDTDTWWVEP
jgi:peptide/nickel transport system substrate-binding protein